MPTIQLNTRQRDILLALLGREGPQTTASLAARLGMSQRVIRYNLGVIRTWMRQKGFPLTARPGVGIMVDATPRERQRISDELGSLNDVTLALNPEQRCRLLLLELLCSTHASASAMFAEHTGVSRTTTFNDFESVEAWLSRFHLTLNRSRKRGVCVSGRELDRRLALVQLLKDELWPDGWHMLWVSSQQSIPPQVSVMSQFASLVAELELRFCERAVSRIEKTLTARLSCSSSAALQTYLALTIHALQRGRVIVDMQDQLEIDSPMWETAQIVAREIEKAFTLSLPVPEIQAIAVCLMAMPRGLDYRQRCGFTCEHPIPDGQALELARSVVKEAAFYLHPCLSTDEDLVSGLALHLGPVVSKLHYGMSIENRILPDIKTNFPGVWDVAERSAAVVAQRLGMRLPDEEVGYLTMHLAAALERLRSATHRRRSAVLVVSDDDISEVVLLQARLRAEFPALDLIEVRDIRDRSTRLPAQAELILSTVHLDDTRLPALQVKAWLGRADVQRIEDWLLEREEEERETAITKPGNASVVDILDVDDIVLGAAARNWEEAVELASAPLLRSGKISPSYVTEMREIIVRHGPYMVLAPGTALVHAKPSDGVNELCLGLSVASAGVPFGHPEFDPVDVVFVLGATDHRSHITALWELLDLIGKAEFREDLRRCHNGSEVLRAMWQQLS